MKILSLTALLFSTQLYAGSWSYSCTSSDGVVNFYREALVLIEKDEDGSISSISSKKENYTFNTGPEVGETLIYREKFDLPANDDVSVNFTKILSEEVNDQSTDCPPGDSGSHGPGYTTTKRIMKATIQQFENKVEKTLTCFETFAWGGRCHFDSQEE